MSYQDKSNAHQMSLIDAVDALSTIVDLDLSPGDINQIQSKLLENKAEKKDVVPISRSLMGKNIDLKLVKIIFRTILYHLQDLYVEGSAYIVDEKKNERIKTIMLLVGEAANKLDRFTGLFHDTHLKTVHELREFKQLQEFYINRVARKIDETLLSKWIFGISGKKLPKKEILVPKITPKKMHTSHVYIDLEGVKKDTEYELFFIRKEDGTRFFDPKLIRSIKLVCDFGSYFKQGKVDDPFADVDVLIDRNIYHFAKMMILSLKKPIDRFYREIKNFKGSEVANILHRAIIALMLAGHSKNLQKNQPVKSCLEYFQDFQVFLRKALNTRDYQRIIAYPDKHLNQYNSFLIDMIHALTHSLFTSNMHKHDTISYIESIIHEATSTQSIEHKEALNNIKQYHSWLSSDYAAMAKLIKSHPNGHLRKILEMVENGDYHYFDPLLQQNLPIELYRFILDNHKIVNLRLPVPIYQENIQKATISEEFKAFLRSLGGGEWPGKFLIFNYQDRTGWKEYARVKALEDLQTIPEFSNCLTVVTIPKETEFYHQESLYAQENHANIFIKNLKNQLIDMNSGFYFPKSIEGLDEFVDKAIEEIHKIFFHSKNVLSREQRLDFIEVFYFFLEIKILDLVKPDYFSLTCKDGVDVSGTANACLFTFFKLLNQEQLSESDRELINFLIYGIPVTTRERLILRDKFERFITALKVFESTRSELGHETFHKLIKESFFLSFKSPILDSKTYFSTGESGEY